MLDVDLPWGDARYPGPALHGGPDMGSFIAPKICPHDTRRENQHGNIRINVHPSLPHAQENLA